MTSIKPTNFIRNQINQDIVDNKYPKIITRFPPEPNGYLHIGHAKSICLNFGIANDFTGACNMRFDDTNPSKESQEYIEAIKQDVKWLGFSWQDEVKFTSDYFQQLFECAFELINKGLAYVCFLSPDEAREYRGNLTTPGTNSPYRETNISDNLTVFNQMKNGEFAESECVLRAKINMSSPFMYMRDPIIYRIRKVHHHQSGDQWCIYPMYDFAHCISDAIESVSHSLCTLEFQDNRRIYDWYLEHLEIGKSPRPYQYEFARLNLEHTVMSKRKLNDLVSNNLVDGWDDPRMPTISGMRRRGFPPQAIVGFCKNIGVSKQDSIIGMEVLENTVRDYLNVSSERRMAVIEPIKVIIEDHSGELETLITANHPQNPEMGERKICFSNQLYIEREDFKLDANKKFKRLVLGKEVRLRNAYVIKANRVEENAQGEITTIFCSYDPDTLGKNPSDGRKVKGVIHFVEASTAVKAKFHLYERLFNDKNPAKLDDISTAINPNSKIIKHGFVEASLKNAKIGEIFQFERLGYFCRDNKGLSFNRTVSLRDTWQSK